MSTVATAQQEQHDRRSTSARELYPVRIPKDKRSNIYDNFRTPQDDVSDTLAELRGMLLWPEDWNGHGAAKPNVTAILRAAQWIIHMRADASDTEEPWLAPHIVPDQDGDIVFEWSNGDRTLSAYASSDAIEYLKVWGANISSQMEGELIKTREDNRNLWLWLMEQV